MIAHHVYIGDVFRVLSMIYARRYLNQMEIKASLSRKLADKEFGVAVMMSACHLAYHVTWPMDIT